MRSVAVSVALAAASVASSNAGTLTTAFTTDPGGTTLIAAHESTEVIRDGILKLVDLKDLINPDTLLIDDRRKPLRGSYIFPALDAGKRVASFVATFKARIGGGTSTPADGFSLVLANDYPTDAPFREAGGSTTGFTIVFKPINGTGAESELHDPTDPPGIIIKQKGVKVTGRAFDGLATDPSGVDSVPVFVPVRVELTADGLLSITYNNKVVYDKVPVGYLPIEGQFGMGSGTEGQASGGSGNFWIDDFSVTTTTVTGAYVVGVEPGTQNVSPDAPIKIDVQDLGAASATMELNGVTVTPTKSDLGGGTTRFTYVSPTLYASSSTNLTKLTFGGKSFSYGFVVSKSQTVPATAAAPAASVDKTKSGFSVRVHQTEANQSLNTAARAEAQLAGELGPNVSDRTSADAKGYFAKELINFGISAAGDPADAGQIPGDEGIPGLPGTSATPNANNAAMEVLGFLDLKAGTYTIGTVADESVKISIGSDPRDATALALVDKGAGTYTATIVVGAAGIYPIRVLWTQVSGVASLELWSQDSAGVKTLLNDASGVKSYAARTAAFKGATYLAQAVPGVGEANASTVGKLKIVLNDDASTVVSSSIKVTLDTVLLTIPAASITKSGVATTVNLALAQDFEGKSSHTVKVEWTDSLGAAAVREYSFTTGKASAGNALNAVKGYWKFNQGNLKASIGNDMAYVDTSIANKYKFGVTGVGEFAAIPGINGKPAKVIFVPFLNAADTENGVKKVGLRIPHDIAANGGGKKVNQYTFIFDAFYGGKDMTPDGGTGNVSIFQFHDLDNPGDADFYWAVAGGYGKSCCSPYDNANAKHLRGEWARIVLAVDLAATPPVFAKYINGVKNGQDIGGTRGHTDSEFALSIPEIVMFGDSDWETSDAYVSAVQVREGRISDDEAAALGGPDAAGIPIPYSQWDFNDAAKPLTATVGADLAYSDTTIAGLYKAGVTGQGAFSGIPNINGKPAGVLFVPYLNAADTENGVKKVGLRIPHGLAANGGGQKVNQYTFIFDTLYSGKDMTPDGGTGNVSIFQFHDLDNPGDGDFYWAVAGGYGKGCCSPYDAVNAQHLRGEWARIVLSVDLAATPPVFAKYINGVKNGQDVGGTRGHTDSEFALSIPEIVMFGDSDWETSDAYISSLQVRQGRMSDDQVAALGGPSADGIPSPNPVKGEWNFDDAANPLKATAGKNLTYSDNTIAGLYKAGVTGQGAFSGIPNINGKPAGVLFVPYLNAADTENGLKKVGLKVPHGVTANGGGQKVNQYTFIFDTLYSGKDMTPDGGTGNVSIFQFHDLDNPGDGDFYWAVAGGYGKGCCSPYDAVNAQHLRGEWARIVLSVDLAATPPVFAKYINGVKNGQDIGGTRGHTDSEFALSIPEIVMFGDSDWETSDAYISALQVREGRMSDEDVAALGGPDAGGIPSASIGAVRATTPQPAAVELVGSATVNGTYATDATAVINTGTKTITVPIGASNHYFRVKGSAKILTVGMSAGKLVLTYQ